MTKLKNSKYLKEISVIAIPIIIQGIVFQLQSLTDKIFLGNIDATYISALGAAQAPVYTTVDSVVALGTGLVIFTSRLWGANNKDKIGSYLRSSLTFVSIIGLILFAIWMLFAEQIFTLLSVDPVIMESTVTYGKFCAAYLIFIGIDSSLQAMLQGMGNTKPIMVAGIIKVALNIAISWVLIFGKFGFPRMEIAGAAIGTLASNIISFIAITIYCFIIKRKEFNILTKFRDFLNFKLFKDVVAIGLPTAAEYFLWNASNLVLMKFLNSLSYTATAIYTLTFGIEIIVYMIFNGTSRATMTIMGHNIGAGDRTGTNKVFNVCLALNTSIVLVFSILFALFSEPILSVFSHETDIIKAAAPMLLFTAAIMLPKSLNVVIGNGIRAHGDAKWMLFSQVIGSVLVIVVAYILVYVAKLDITAIYITLLLDESTRAVINFIRYRKRDAFKPTKQTAAIECVECAE